VAVFAGTATAASGGNSANAKLCQKGGWENLVSSTGTAFTSEEACTSYAARGGTLSPKPTFEQQYQTTCENAGGSFVVVSTTSGNRWECSRFDPLLPDFISLESALAPICTAAGGQPGGIPDAESLVYCQGVPS
jgi:hypothetical protein